MALLYLLILSNCFPSVLDAFAVHRMQLDV